MSQKLNIPGHARGLGSPISRSPIVQLERKAACGKRLGHGFSMPFNYWRRVPRHGSLIGEQAYFGFLRICSGSIYRSTSDSKEKQRPS